MKTRKEYDRSEVEAMLRGGTFRPSAEMEHRLRTRLWGEQQIELRKMAHWPVSRPVLTAVFTMLAALAFITAVVALSPKEKAASVVNGIGVVYNAGLVQHVNDSQQAGDISLTVDWVYADWNHILVAYSAQGPAEDPDHIEIQVVTAVLDDGTALQGGPISGYTQPGTEATVATFVMPETIKSQEVLHMQIGLRASRPQYLEMPKSEPGSDTPAGQAAPVQIDWTGGGEVTFTLSIPITPGKVIEVDKTVDVQGIAAKLERVSIAPSSTIATLCFQVPDPEHYRDWIPIVSLSTAGKQFHGWGSSGYMVGDTYSCQQVNIWESVPLDQERYVFRLEELVGFKFGPGDSPTVNDQPEQQMRIKGPWVFDLK